MYLQAHMELDPECKLLAMGWGKIAMAKFHQALLTPDVFRCTEPHFRRGMVKHHRPSRIAPNMIPGLVMMANTVPSPYRAPTKWETLEEVRHPQPEAPPPLNDDGTGCLVAVETSPQYVLNGEWELLHPETGPQIERRALDTPLTPGDQVLDKYTLDALEHMEEKEANVK